MYDSVSGYEQWKLVIRYSKFLNSCLNGGKKMSGLSKLTNVLGTAISLKIFQYLLVFGGENIFILERPN